MPAKPSEHVEQIKAMLNDGLTRSVIAERLGLNLFSLYHFLARRRGLVKLKLKRRTRKLRPRYGTREALSDRVTDDDIVDFLGR